MSGSSVPSASNDDDCETATGAGRAIQPIKPIGTLIAAAAARPIACARDCPAASPPIAESMPHRWLAQSRCTTTQA